MRIALCTLYIEEQGAYHGFMGTGVHITFYATSGSIILIHFNGDLQCWSRLIVWADRGHGDPIQQFLKHGCSAGRSKCPLLRSHSEV